MQFQYVNILCEGPSEEQFIKRVLGPYLVSLFGKCEGMSKSVLKELAAERDRYGTPEEINNSEQTAPSKRILRLYPSYQKVSYGTMIAETIGVERMIEQCPHFAKWVEQMKKL